MSTSVQLEVKIGTEVDPDRDVAPADVVAAALAAGQPGGHGWSRKGSQPWRLCFQVTGEDRVATGQALKAALGQLGYEVELSILR